MNPRTVGIAALVLGLGACAANRGRQTPDGAPRRVIHMTRSFSLGGLTQEFEVAEHPDGTVRGRLWATSGEENRHLIALFDCAVRPMPPDRKGRPRWLCEAQDPKVDWADALAALDRAGVMTPPPEDTPPPLCLDGPPGWSLEVRTEAPADTIRTSKRCRGSKGEERRRFEAALDSILGRVLTQVGGAR